MEIPTYPASRPLELSDQQLLEPLFQTMQPQMSEMTFAGIYLFRNTHNYRLSILEGTLLISATGYDGKNYFMPPLGSTTYHAVNTLLSDGASIYCSEKELQEWIQVYPTVNCSELRDSYDYLYQRNDLAMLPGKLFHKKKNRINYFTRRHKFNTVKYSADFMTDCLSLLDFWAKHQLDSGASVAGEQAATSEALTNAAKLGLSGLVIIVNDTVAAFSLGEQLNQTTAVCHFEKAAPFMEGAYQLINQEFARLLFTDCSHINREQDLGQSGLRTAKLSYHPSGFIKKYLITGKP